VSGSSRAWRPDTSAAACAPGLLRARTARAGECPPAAVGRVRLPEPGPWTAAPTRLDPAGAMDENRRAAIMHPHPLQPTFHRTRRLAAGCAAGLAIGALASWLHFALTGTLAVETRAAPYIVSAFALGVGLALACTCSLRMQRDAEGLAVDTIFFAALGMHAAAALALPLTSRDLFSYIAYGQLQDVGLNPYLSGPRALGDAPIAALVAPRWVDMPSAYGPTLNLLFWAAAAIGRRLGSTVWATGAALKLLMMGASMGALAVARRWTRGMGSERAERFAVLALSPLLAWELSGQVHNDAMLVLALSIFAWAAWGGRELVAALALALAGVTKLPLVPLLPIYLAFIARRSARRAAALALAAACLAALAFVPYWRGAATFRAAATGVVGIHAHSLADLLALALPAASPLQPLAYRLCWSASMALTFGLFVRAAYRATSLDQVVHGSVTLLLGWYLTTPWFQPWYVSWILPLGAAHPDARWRRLLSEYAAITLVQWMVPLDPITTVAGNLYVVLRVLRLGGLEPGVAPA
jgi:hypothetical protein